MSIEPLSEEYAINIWNTFVSQYQGITPFSFNPSLFYFYKKHFKWKPYYLLVFEKDELCAVLPLVNTGKAWVSLPHMSYGGMLFSGNIAKYNLINIINNLIEETDFYKLKSGFYRFNLDEIKTDTPKNSKKLFIRTLEEQGGYEFQKSIKVSSILKLPEKEECLSRQLNSNLKRKIRKATKSGITVKSGGLELMDDFHKVYSLNISALKSLDYSKKTLINLFKTYQDGLLKIFIAIKDNKTVGGALMSSYYGFYENMFFATSQEARKDYVSDLLHHEMIKYCISNNQKIEVQQIKQKAVYSFGRSTLNSGVHKYKSHWPVKDYPIYVHSNMGDLRNHHWITNIWGLLPYFIAKPLGEKIIKHIY
jgi:hypothetical protein